MLAVVAIGEYKLLRDAMVTTIIKDKEFIPDESLCNKYVFRYEIYKELYQRNKELLHNISNI